MRVLDTCKYKDDDGASWAQDAQPSLAKDEGGRSYKNLFISHAFDGLSDLIYRHQLTPQQQEDCYHNIYQLLMTAGEQNWDGEGADPVTEDTLAIAHAIVNKFPGEVGIPEISSDPDGCVEFDWHLDNGTMFTISIGKDGDIAVSGLNDGIGELTATQWDHRGDIDLLLQCGLKWLKEMQER